MKITYNTPISDIIDPNEVYHIFYLYEQDTTKKLLKKGQAIDEQTAGSKGFSKKSCRINGTTILYNKARAIAKLAERTYKEEESIRHNAVEKAKDQREKELKLLHTAIVTRIEELKADKASTQESYDNIGASASTSLPSHFDDSTKRNNELKAHIEFCEAEIRRLTKKQKEVEEAQKYARYLG